MNGRKSSSCVYLLRALKCLREKKIDKCVFTYASEKKERALTRAYKCVSSVFFPLRTNFRSEREKRKKRTKTIFFFSFAGCASFFFLGSLCFVTSSSSFWLLSLPQWISSKAHSGGNEGSHAGGIGLFPMEIAFLNLEENINSIRLPKILQPCERGKTTYTRPVTIVGAVTHSKQILAQ